MENDQSARRMGIRLLTGTPSASPQPPALTRNAQVWELSLAQVRVRASATTIASEDVTDERGDAQACGYAVSRWLDRAVAGRVVNSLTMTEPGYALDARQGRALDEKITRLSAEAARTARYSATLTAAGWSASAPYTQTASAAGVLGYGRSLRGRGHERRVGVRAGHGAHRGVGVRGPRHGGQRPDHGVLLRRQTGGQPAGHFEGGEITWVNA